MDDRHLLGCGGLEMRQQVGARLLLDAQRRRRRKRQSSLELGLVVGLHVDSGVGLRCQVDAGRLLVGAQHAEVCFGIHRLKRAEMAEGHSLAVAVGLQALPRLQEASLPLLQLLVGELLGAGGWPRCNGHSRIRAGGGRQWHWRWLAAGSGSAVVSLRRRRGSRQHPAAVA